MERPFPSFLGVGQRPKRVDYRGPAAPGVQRVITAGSFTISIDVCRSNGAALRTLCQFTSLSSAVSLVLSARLPRPACSAALAVEVAQPAREQHEGRQARAAHGDFGGFSS